MKNERRLKLLHFALWLDALGLCIAKEVAKWTRKPASWVRALAVHGAGEYDCGWLKQNMSPLYAIENYKVMQAIYDEAREHPDPLLGCQPEGKFSGTGLMAAYDAEMPVVAYEGARQ